MAIVFDAASKRIILDTTAITATELYSRWVDWALQGDNIKYGMVFRQVGSDDLGGGLSIPPYFFLQGDWRVRPMEASHTLIITGNLFVEGGGVPVVPTLGTYNVSVQYTVPVQAQGISTSGSDPSSIASAVWSHSDGLIIRKMLANKVTKTGNLITIYEDDNTTVWREYDLADGGRVLA